MAADDGGSTSDSGATTSTEADHHGEQDSPTLPAARTKAAVENMPGQTTVTSTSTNDDILDSAAADAGRDASPAPLAHEDSRTPPVAGAKAAVEDLPGRAVISPGGSAESKAISDVVLEGGQDASSTTGNQDVSRIFPAGGSGPAVEKQPQAAADSPEIIGLQDRFNTLSGHF